MKRFRDLFPHRPPTTADAPDRDPIIAETKPAGHLTTDPDDPRLTHGIDTEPVDQADTYLVLSDEEIAMGFIRPLRNTYRHDTCGATTTMGPSLSRTYAASPHFYAATFCATCRMHRPVAEFTWSGDGTRVGT